MDEFAIPGDQHGVRSTLLLAVSRSVETSRKLHHVPVQASPLTAKEWIELERHATTFTDPRSQLCGVWLLMLAGVVRYAHLLRSPLSRDADMV